MFRWRATVDITAVVRAVLRTKRKVFRQSNRWLWEPSLKRILLKEFFMVKKTFVFFVVLSIITAGIVFADSSGVSISYSHEGGYATIHNENDYGVTVYYTVYYEDDSLESDSDWCVANSTESFYIGGLTQDIINIEITDVVER
jgi:hypothetical protein